MTTETIIWTALPNGNTEPGGAGGKLRLSVYVAPRLSAAGTQTLAQFPHFLDWPETLRGVTFEVGFAGGPTLKATVVSKPDPALWKALFDADVGVDPYKFDRAGLLTGTIHSYPVMRVATAMKQGYQQVSRYAGQERQRGGRLLPGTEALLSLFKELKPSQRYAELFNPKGGDQPGSRSPKERAIPPTQQIGGLSGDFTRMQLFFQRPAGGSTYRSSRPSSPLPTTAELRSQLDFHRILGALGNYPHLLPLLGLVVDLEVENAAGIPAAGTVQLRTSAFSGSPHVHPLTHYLLDEQGFRAASRPDSPLQDGLLRLGDPTLFDLLPFDVDGAALKAVSMIASLEQSLQRPAPGLPLEAGVPALRSAGLSLVESGRAYNLAAHLGNAADLQDAATSGTPVELYADDLVRGYAIDVYTGHEGTFDADTGTAYPAYKKQARAWLPLCRRDGTYTLSKPHAHNPLTSSGEEGFVTLSTSKAPDGMAGHFLHESWLHWEGWSLVAPRPGKSVAPDGSSAAAANDPINQIGLKVRFKAHPGSLPRLRFGLSYAMRARAVDLAGHGVASDAKVADRPAVRTAMHTYYRYEPLSFPALALRASIKASPGESQARLVIRSDYDRTVAQYYHEQSSPPYNQYAERHIVPPKTSEMLAEAHGMLDGPIPPGTPADQRSWYEIMIKRDVALGGDNADHPDPATEQEHVFGTDRLRLPYLPDPLAHGASLDGLPGLPGPAPFLEATYGGTWPDLRPFRIKIVDPSGAAPAPPRWDGGAGELTVELAKADRITVALSTTLTPAALELMGVWHWIVEAKEEELRKLALEGLLPLLTPARQITLVHAVQRPLIEPAFSHKLHADRTPIGGAAATPLGSTSATLIDIPMPLSGKSTIKLDLYAHWYEPADDVAKPGPEVLEGNAHVAESPMAAEDTEMRFEAGDRTHTQQFRDTKYRRVAYTAAATTRFREYFPASITGDPANITRASKEGQLQRPDAANPSPLFEPDYAHPLPLGVVDVPSTARPQVPRLLYVVPTFGHEVSATPDGVASTRSGGGLRIYLERPWYSSGGGELLGVVLAPEGRHIVGESKSKAFFGSYKAPDAAHLTQWGLDPARLSRSLPAGYAPAADRFPASVVGADGLTIDEQPGTAVTVVGHEVAYDPDRRLWYCDITIDPGNAYYPFVRLALARFQPHSVRDAELSRIVLADFMQLAPDRSASVVIDSQDARLLHIAVNGPVPQRTTNVLTASVEQQTGGGGDDPVGWIPVANVELALTPLIFNRPSARGVWTGRLQLPKLGSTVPPVRLVLREYEVYQGDTPSTNTRANPGQRRLVYADVVDILLPH